MEPKENNRLTNLDNGDEITDLEDLVMIENGDLDIKTILREDGDVLSSITLPEGPSRGKRILFV